MVFKILASPCAYKGTLSALQVAIAIRAGIHECDIGAEVAIAPIADGGDGTLEAIKFAQSNHVEHVVDVHGPVGNPVKASWLSIAGSAVVELAGSCGIALLPRSELLPFDSHTLGLGEVINDCLRSQPETLYICLGGSASTDGGAGALTALGAEFRDSVGAPVGLGNQALGRIESCELSALRDLIARSSLRSVKIAVDVANPLLGEFGAAAIFGPQKGARDSDVERLESNLKKFADIVEATTGKRIRESAGAGAAGGTAFGLASLLGGQLISGFQWLADIIGLESQIATSDLIISAEGCLDSQSLSGKAIGELSLLCRKYGKPLWVMPALAQPEIDWRQYDIEKVVPIARDGIPADAAGISQAMRREIAQLQFKS